MSNNQIETHTFATFIEDKGEILIPIVQRDYAQGRERAAEVRSQFLYDIFEVLSDRSSGKTLDLGFVYGSSLDNKFTPIDGQQRLTTLFLLYCYFKSEVVTKKKTLSYHTRLSSADFIAELYQHPLPLTEIRESEKKANLNAVSNNTSVLSAFIRNQSWFSSMWLHDPTVQGALSMLDAIHDKAKDFSLDELKNAANNLENINFRVLQLDDFSEERAEDLYIKMNARGKQLSYFENFKAQLFQHFDVAPNGSKAEKKGDLATALLKLDTDWLEYFWDLSGGNDIEKTENFMLRVIYAVLCDAVALASIDNKDFIEKIHSAHKTDKRLDYDTNKQLLDVIKGESHSSGFFAKYITYLMGRDLIKYAETITESVKSKWHERYQTVWAGYADSVNTLYSIKDGDISYKDRARFFALYIYAHSREATPNNAEQTEKVLDWLRLIYNYTEHDDINANNYSSLLYVIRYLYQNSNNGESALEAAVKRSEKGLFDVQWQEERAKAYLMLNGCKNRILNAETHEYFNGRIKFLLEWLAWCQLDDSFALDDKYCKEKRAAEVTDLCDAYISNGEINFLAKLTDYCGLINELFDANGLKEKYDTSFRYALLKRGNYLIEIGSETTRLWRIVYSFCRNKCTQGLSSWNKVFTERCEPNLFFKCLCDDILQSKCEAGDIEAGDITDYLKQSKYEKSDGSPKDIQDPREYIRQEFLHCPQLFKFYDEHKTGEQSFAVAVVKPYAINGNDPNGDERKAELLTRFHTRYVASNAYPMAEFKDELCHKS